MAERLFIFRGGSTELVLPVTPPSFEIERGKNIEIVNIHELGDVVMAGHRTLATISVACLLPAHPYSFARDDDPDRYVDQLTRWALADKVVRFIISGSGINLPCLVQSVKQGERDGTNDVYVDIILREAPPLKAVQLTAGAANATRAAPDADEGVQTYKVVYGDTLSGICRRFYGDGTAASYNKLAAYNGKPNPNILMAGEVLKIPTPLC